MVNEKWVLLQPSHHHGGIAPINLAWTNDSFLNASKFLRCPLYNITDDNIPLDKDVYWFVHYTIIDLENEIKLMKILKEKGKKIFLTFSHDLRFLVGDGLLNSEGKLWTELCKLTDGIGSGVSDDLKIFGRYQDKCISFGDILLNFDYSKPYNERSIDIITSGPPGEQFLSFGLETLLMIKEKHPDKRIVCLVQLHHKELIKKLQVLYPEIEFPSENVKQLMEYMRESKFYFNFEMRPRPGRAMMEAYYCRTPFISSSFTYFSKICKELSYDKMSIVDIVNTYSNFLNSDPIKIIKIMEDRGDFDFFDSCYKRIKTKIGI